MKIDILIRYMYIFSIWWKTSRKTGRNSAQTLVRGINDDVDVAGRDVFLHSVGFTRCWKRQRPKTTANCWNAKETGVEVGQQCVQQFVEQSERFLQVQLIPLKRRSIQNQTQSIKSRQEEKFSFSNNSQAQRRYNFCASIPSDCRNLKLCQLKFSWQLRQCHQFKWRRNLTEVCYSFLHYTLRNENSAMEAGFIDAVKQRCNNYVQ